ncbi:MAG: TetR family transcriptional regulator [Woeseiaceae bacterium]|nr:TetR family transcriptional regulator [Woeseiaceae bacterium]
MSIHSNYAIIATPMATTATAKPRRTASREARRRQLIEATMKCIARKGMGSTTLGDVAKEAGLSQGIVNLHFESKDNLLTETLRALAGEYRENFDKTLEKSGPRPADSLLALMESDLRPSICDRQKLAIWFAFWGEVKSRPTYRRICDEYDNYYDSVVERLCADLIEDGAYENIDAAAAAEALTSMTNGLWLSCLISPQGWDRHKAMEAVMSYLTNVFPKHYSNG